MKRMLGLLVMLSILYFGAQFLFNLVEKGHEINYEITFDDVSYKINEVFTVNTDNEEDGYYFKIELEDKTFSYQIFDDFNMQREVITNILYFNDEQYTCILPIFVKDTISSDMMCLNNGSYSLYHNIIGKDEKLDEFAKSLKDYGYDVSNFNDKTEYEEDSGLNVYDLYNLDYVLVESYKGVYVISNSSTSSYVSHYKLFTKDTYERPISAFIKNYYVVADYNQETKFNKFYILNIKTGKQETIEYDYDISMNSYVQGVVDNSVYIFDRDNLKQYELNIKTDTVIEVGNENAKIKVYSDYKFNSVNAYDAKNSNIYFNEYTTSNTLNGKTYYKIDKTGSELSGYYYLYEKVDNSYKLYRTPVKDSNNIVYLFTLTDINDVVYDGNLVYYRVGDRVKLYSDLMGERTLISYNELGFNSNLKISIY